MTKKSIAIFITISLILTAISLHTFAASQDEISVILNGEKLDLENLLIIEDENLLAPVTSLFEALGGVVNWDEATNTITITTITETLELTVGSNIVKGFSDIVELDEPVKIIDGKAFVYELSEMIFNENYNEATLLKIYEIIKTFDTTEEEEIQNYMLILSDEDIKQAIKSGQNILYISDYYDYRVDCNRNGDTTYIGYDINMKPYFYTLVDQIELLTPYGYNGGAGSPYTNKIERTSEIRYNVIVR